MTTVTRDMTAIRKSAESMDAAKTEVIGTASAGDVVRQGDLYLVCLGDESVIGGALVKSRQLAPGTTQGSRHCVDGHASVFTADANDLAACINRLTKCETPVELIGPVVRCHEAATITHPEHGNKVLPAGSTWAVVYQRAYSEEVRRVHD